MNTRLNAMRRQEPVSQHKSVAHLAHGEQVLRLLWISLNVRAQVLHDLINFARAAERWAIEIARSMV